MSEKRRDNKGCVFRTGESQRKDGRYLYKSVDGYHGFLFVDDTGRPNTARRYQDILKYAVREYNQTHADQLPKVTPHVLRRTFCTRLANRNINPKSLQYIMGHSDINITLNLYPTFRSTVLKQKKL